MKKAVIVHCWGGEPKYCWYPQTKKELEEKGFEVVVPEMPDTHYPKLPSWLQALQKAAGDPRVELFLIGHSVGCITILKYLEQLKQDEKVGGVILVAGFTESLGPGYEEIDNFFEQPANFEYIKTNAEYFVAIHSDDDKHVSLKFGNLLKDKLSAKLIIKHAQGHFSGPFDDDVSITSLPDVTSEILKMTK